MADVELTQEQKDTIAAWLNEKGRNYDCPVCSENNWQIGGHLISSMVEYGGGNIVLGGVRYPQFFLVCNNCFYTRNFMATPVLSLDKLQENEDATEQEEISDAAGEANG